MTEEERKQEFTALFEYLVYAQELDDFGMRVAVVKILGRWEAVLAEWEPKGSCDASASQSS